MNFHLKKEKQFTLKSIISKKLIKKEIKEICLLKDQHWKFGLNSQLRWFENNVKKKDINNLLYIKSKLIGYTLLRKRTCKIDNLEKKTNYLLFDTLIIDKNFRNIKLSNLLMNFNNLIIKDTGLFSFLVCENKLVNFYTKNEWKKLNRKIFDIANSPSEFNGMVFNKSNLNKKYIFYLNK